MYVTDSEQIFVRLRYSKRTIKRYLIDNKEVCKTHTEEISVIDISVGQLNREETFVETEIKTPVKDN